MQTVDIDNAFMFRQVMKDHTYKMMNQNDKNVIENITNDECDYGDEDVEFVSKNCDSILISLVKNYPHLYVKTSKLQKDHSLREKSWQDIATVLKQPAGECLKRWTRLRERYSKEKRLNEQNIKNGIQIEGRQCWPHYQEMGFLAQHIVGRRSYRNLNAKSKQLKYDRHYQNETLSNERTEYPSHSPNHVPFTSTLIVSSSSPSPSMSSALINSPDLISPDASEPSQGYRSCNHSESMIEKIEESVSNHFQNSQYQQTETSEDLFCKYLASELKKMSESEKKAATKRLMNALFKGDT